MTLKQGQCATVLFFSTYKKPKKLGERREGTGKPRPIVVKFNYHQDKEFIRFNARKLKGTGIGVSEQYPEEIEKTQKSLYPCWELACGAA